MGNSHPTTFNQHRCRRSSLIKPTLRDLSVCLVELEKIRLKKQRCCEYVTFDRCWFDSVCEPHCHTSGFFYRLVALTWTRITCCICVDGRRRLDTKSTFICCSESIRSRTSALVGVSVAEVGLQFCEAFGVLQSFVRHKRGTNTINFGTARIRSRSRTQMRACARMYFE